MTVECWSHCPFAPKGKIILWDKQYKLYKHLWGERPSELACFAVAYLQQSQPSQKTIDIVDIGCGYGRDVLYLSQHIKCSILGIDNSQKAIKMAKETCSEKHASDVTFQCCDFTELATDKYHVVLISNLYHLLKLEQRTKLREMVKSILEPSGLVFLSTLSVRDLEHYSKGIAVIDEDHSFLDEMYLHFCIREELECDFNFLAIKELYEHEYDEPRATGGTHHHISWILVGQYLDHI